MIKPRKLTTRQYVGLVRDLNSRMAQLPPLFEDSQVIEESELFDFLANKAPKSHKAILINQGFNPECSLTSNVQSTRSSRKFVFLTNLRISSRFFELDLPSKRV